MKRIYNFLMLSMAALLIFGSDLSAQTTETWNISPTWNAAKESRGIAYNPNLNRVYVASSSDANSATANVVKVLDANDGTEIKTIDLSPLTINGGGYGVKDVEVSLDGGIFGTVVTTNLDNPFIIYYWENEDADPVVLYKATSDLGDFGPGFTVSGDMTDDAVIMVPMHDLLTMIVIEVTDGVIGDPVIQTPTGITAGAANHMQAIGTSYADGFWFSNSTTAPTLVVAGTAVGSINPALFSGATGDVKQFTAGSNTYLAISEAGSVHIFDITSADATFSNITATELVETIAGTAPSAAGWPPENGDGQEQAAFGNPDGSYAIVSLSSSSYIKMNATDGAPAAVNAKLSGSPLVGEVKTVEYTYADINNDAEGTSIIKWYIADDAIGTGIAEITANAGNTTYTLDAADAGKYISFTVQAVAATGTTSDPLHLASSTPFGPVLTVAEPPVATDAAITGTAQVGVELTASYTYSDPNMDLEGNSIYKWYRSDVNDGTGMTMVAEGSLNYTPVGEDAEKYLAFVVTPVAASGYLLEGDADTAFTAETVLFPPMPPSATDVVISGREDVAATLTASYTYVDLNGEVEDGSVYKWYRADDNVGTNEAEIASGSLTYTLVADDEGKYIAFEVTPDNATDDPGTPVKVYTGAINPEPAPVAPVASDVVLSGTPEVDALLSASYTYSDDIDDPEGASIYKWYMADDAAGTNQTQIAGASTQAYKVTDAELGKFLAFEVTPVALTGGALEGTPVLSNYTAAAAVASDNTFGLERIFLASSRKGAVPHYMTTVDYYERGIGVGEDNIYIASRYNGLHVYIVDNTEGTLVGELNVDGISGGLYAINDIEVSDDGQILAAPLSFDGEFWIYKWENDLATPTKWLTVSAGFDIRLGDKISVTGDLTSDAVVIAAEQTGARFVRWRITGGVAGDAEVLTLGDITDMQYAPAIIPFSMDADAKMLIDGKGFYPTIIDKDLNKVANVHKIDDYSAYKIQSNSPNVFMYKGRTLAAFYQAMRQDPLGSRIIVADITAEPFQIIDSSEYIADVMGGLDYLGDLEVRVDGDYYYAYMMQGKAGIGAFRGTLELPVFSSAITSHDGTMIDVTFDMAMTETGKTDASVWTITAAGNAIAVDSIHSDAAVITFELASAIAEGDAVTIAYDGTGVIKAFNSLPLAAFGPEDVENITGAEAPVASDVAISGGERTGETLTGTYTYSDPESDAEGTSLFQWYYADDDAGTNALKIIGEKAMTYTITSEVEGKYIGFEVTPVAATGGMDYLVGTPVMSNYVRIIPTSIDNNSMDQINVYPNPVVNVLTIDNASNITAISVIDVTGKQIQNISIANESTITVDMSAFNNGLYYVKLQDEAGASSVVKVVKVQ